MTRVRKCKTFQAQADKVLLLYIVNIDNFEIWMVCAGQGAFFLIYFCMIEKCELNISKQEFIYLSSAMNKNVCFFLVEMFLIFSLSFTYRMVSII